MLLGVVLIAKNSFEYFDLERLPAFVIEKLPVRFETFWLASLRIHVASACLAFPLCLLSMSRRLQARHVVHRWLGRAAGVLVLLVLVPSGIVLSFEATGGPPVTVGFLLSAAIVALAVPYGVFAARRRDFVAHRRAMLHVVAQLSVAVSSRSMILVLDLCGVAPELGYVLALWIPVVASALGAELAARGAQSPLRLVKKSLERIRDEVSSSAAVVRFRAVLRPVSRPSR
jgi:uncharacterized membrane protein YozB (DUF420 family)